MLAAVTGEILRIYITTSIPVRVIKQIESPAFIYDRLILLFVPPVVSVLMQSSALAAWPVCKIATVLAYGATRKTAVATAVIYIEIVTDADTRNNPWLALRRVRERGTRDCVHGVTRYPSAIAVYLVPEPIRE